MLIMSLKLFKNVFVRALCYIWTENVFMAIRGYYYYCKNVFKASTKAFQAVARKCSIKIKFLKTC